MLARHRESLRDSSDAGNQEVDASNGLCGGGNPSGTKLGSTRLPPLHGPEPQDRPITNIATMDIETAMEGDTCIVHEKIL
jgi:hypothetical protein